jgi:pilus assembly protein CpaF
MEGEMITMQDIFVFEKRGVSATGEVLGQVRPSGIRPQFTDKLIAAGLRLPPSLFDRASA